MSPTPVLLSAKCDQEHFSDYLKGLDSDLDFSFLQLKLIRPFDFFISDGVFKLGRFSH